MTMITAVRYLGVSSRGERFIVLTGDVTIDAGEGNDAIQTGLGQDSLVGGGGTDQFDAGGGADTIFGDRPSGSQADDGNDIIIAGDGDDLVFAGGAEDWVFGGAGNDFIQGGDGDDMLQGNAGADTIHGGAGNDLLLGNNPHQAYYFSMAFSFDGVTDAALVGALSSFFDIRGDDDAPDHLEGGAGRDDLVGYGGNDTLIGGTGDDLLEGGTGADWLQGDDGFDLARYAHFPTGVLIRLDAGAGWGGEADGDILVGIEGVIGTGFTDFLIGAAQDEILFGDSGADWLYGQGGADTLYGGHGSDQILGGAGPDDLYGDGGNDQFWFLASEFQAGVTDRVLDWGAGDGFDYLRFEGVSQSGLLFLDRPGYVEISLTGFAESGIVLVFGTSVTQLAVHLVFG